MDENGSARLDEAGVPVTLITDAGVLRPPFPDSIAAALAASGGVTA